MDAKTKQLIESLQRNPAAVQALFQTPDGQRLMQMLTAGDQGASLQRAAQNASRGSTAEMVQMVSRVMKSPEGAALVERIQRAAQK